MYQVEYRNNPTVCCVLQPYDGNGLVLIRRGLEDGYGKLALPGGFQNFGESMYTAAARELKEETGLIITERDLFLAYGATDEFCHNVLFFQNLDTVGPTGFIHDEEILEVLVVKETPPIDEIAYPMHAVAIARFLGR
jgi:ADP-ribose pyrophosphatase YjhB (NUDIX family)